jgi:hypothetical protein
MTQSNGASANIWTESFKQDFAKVRPLITREWPAVDGEALLKTDGDLDRVISLVAESTSHTSALVRTKLEELHGLAIAPPRGARDPMIELLERLEKKTTDLASELRSSALPHARDKVKDNLLVSLLVAVGLGFILGVIFVLGGGRRDR